MIACQQNRLQQPQRQKTLQQPQTDAADAQSNHVGTAQLPPREEGRQLRGAEAALDARDPRADEPGLRGEEVPEARQLRGERGVLLPKKPKASTTPAPKKPAAKKTPRRLEDTLAAESSTSRKAAARTPKTPTSDKARARHAAAVSTEADESTKAARAEARAWRDKYRALEKERA